MAFKSEHDIPMEAGKMFEFTVGALASSKSVQSGGSGASYTFVFALLISLGVSLITGGSIELMWSLANTLQIIFYFGYLNLYYTPELLAVFSYMKFSNFDNPIFDYIKEKTSTIFSLLDISVFSSNDLFGLSSTSIIINFMDKLMIISLVGMLVLSLLLLSYFCRNKDNKVANFIKRKDIEIRYEGLSRFFFEIVLSLSFVSFINLIYGNWRNPFNIISYAFATIFILCCFYMILYCFLYSSIYYYDILVYPERHERHCLLFFEFNTDKVRNLFFYAYFIVHRMSFSLIIACMSNFPINQCVLTLFVNLLYLLYTFKVFKSCLQSFLHTFNCLILVCLSCLLPLFLNTDDPNKLEISGYICIGLILVFFIINWLIVIPNVFAQIYRKLKSCCCGKSKEEIEAEKRRQAVIHVPSFHHNSINTINTTIRSKYPIVKDDDEQWNNIVIERVVPSKARKTPQVQKDQVKIQRIEEESKNLPMDFYRNKNRINFNIDF